MIQQQYHVTFGYFRDGSCAPLRQHMPSKETLARHRSQVEVWQAPSELFGYTAALMDKVGSVELFTNPRLGFIAEAWAAAKFADLSGAEAVRLIAERDQWPDFQIRRDGADVAWEFTEADVEGRRRGDEYRASAARRGAQRQAR